jgi:Uma2 family endonuclease
MKYWPALEQRKIGMHRIQEYRRMVLTPEADLPEFPPSDLISEEPPLETYRHLMQIILLLTCLEWHWQDRHDFFAGANLSIYYNIRQLRNRDFRGPDFFVVLATERKERKSWVVWEEDGKYPNLILEILSESTAATDRGLKKQLYQDVFRTPEYFWYDPYSFEFQGFHLSDSCYQAIEPNPQGWLWSQQLNLYLGIHSEQLRFFTSAGQLVPTPQEDASQQLQLAQMAQQQAQQEHQRAQQERQRANQEEQRAQQERQRADRLAARLRELGVDPTEL